MGHVVSRSEHSERISQAELSQQVFDFRAKASAGDGKGKLARNFADEIDCAGKNRQSITDGFPVGARLPCNQFVAPHGVKRAAVAAEKMLHNAPVVESEVIAVVLLLSEHPPLLGRHLLSEFQNQRLA